MSIAEALALSSLIDQLSETDRERLLQCIFDNAAIPDDIRQKLQKLMDEEAQVSAG